MFEFLLIIRKRPYLSQMALNLKNKGTLLSRTLKVGEKNVPSEFRFMAYWPRYGRFYICFSITSFPDLPSKSKDSLYLPLRGLLGSLLLLLLINMRAVVRGTWCQYLICLQNWLTYLIIKTWVQTRKLQQGNNILSFKSKFTLFLVLLTFYLTNSS